MDRKELEKRGFVGWLPLLDAARNPAFPNLPGVYAVSHCAERPEEWPKSSCGGWFKGKDPSVDPERLDREWVDATDIVYIGKTDQTLRTRIATFARYGNGEAVAHQGGRLVWQLPDVGLLKIGWKALEDGQATAEEASLLYEFRDVFGRLPFANLRH